MRLLLQSPQQAALTSPEELLGLGQPAGSLLVELVSLLKASPHISTPALLGAWHGTEQGEQLTALAASEFLTPHEGLDREFRDVLRALRLAAMETELQAATELDTIARLKRDIEALKRSG